MHLIKQMLLGGLCSHFSLRHGIFPPGWQRRGLQLLLPKLVQAAAGHRLELWENRPPPLKPFKILKPPQIKETKHSLEVGR